MVHPASAVNCAQQFADPLFASATVAGVFKTHDATDSIHKIIVAEHQQRRTQVANPSAIIGAPVGRVEGAEKASGKAVYGADVHFPGTLWGKILRSPHPHARILRVDTTKAWQVP